jgi:hypothetical protein
MFVHLVISAGHQPAGRRCPVVADEAEEPVEQCGVLPAAPGDGDRVAGRWPPRKRRASFRRRDVLCPH